VLQTTKRSVHLLSHRRLLASALVTVAACQEPAPLYPKTAPSGIQEACALTERKCTACHDRDRIVDARNDSVAQWQMTVDRMRRMPGSSITRADSEMILRCLTYNAQSSMIAPGFPVLVADGGRRCELRQSSAR